MEQTFKVIATIDIETFGIKKGQIFTIKTGTPEFKIVSTMMEYFKPIVDIDETEEEQYCKTF